MARAARVRLTAGFERNLEALAACCDEAGAPQAFERLLDELGDTVIPNLRAELRAYLMAEHLVLYLVAGARVFLLSIRHPGQLSFDFEALWLGE